MNPHDNLDDPEFIHPALRGRLNSNLMNELPSGPSAKAIRVNKSENSLFGDEEPMPGLESIPSNNNENIISEQSDTVNKDKIDLDVRLPSLESNYSSQPASKPKKLSLFAQRRLQKQKESSNSNNPSENLKDSDTKPIIGEIIDHLPASTDVESPIMVQPGGFPQVTRDFISTDSTPSFNALRGLASQSAGDGNDIDNQMKQSISQENDQRLASMSPEEIQAQLNVLFSSVRPETIKALERLRGKKDSSGSSNPSEHLQDTSHKSKETLKKVSFDIPNDTPKKERVDADYLKYFQGVPIEHDKLEWMNNLQNDVKKELDTSETFRFNLQGLPILDSALTDDSYLGGLHHHGDQPHLPGYTIKELLTLSRSTNLSQSCLALDILSKIIHNCQRGNHSLWEKTRSLILNEGACLFMRGTLGMGNRSPITFAIKGIAESIVNLEMIQLEDQLFEYGHFDKSSFTSQFGVSGYSDTQNQINMIKNDPESDIRQLGQMDAIMYLLNTDILGGLCHLLKESALPKNSLDHILLILNSVSVHSKSAAKEIWDTKGLMTTIKKRFLTNPSIFFKEIKEDEVLEDLDMVDPYNYDLPPNLLAFRLIRQLIRVDEDIAQDVFSNHYIPLVSPPPASNEDRLEPYFAVLNEIIGIWKELISVDQVQLWSHFRSEGLPNVRRFFGLNSSDLIQMLAKMNNSKLNSLFNSVSNWFSFLNIVITHPNYEWQDVIKSNSSISEFFDFGLKLCIELTKKSENIHHLLLSNLLQFLHNYNQKFPTPTQINYEAMSEFLVSNLTNIRSQLTYLSSQVSNYDTITQLNQWTNLKARQLGPHILPPNMGKILEFTNNLVFNGLSTSIQLIKILSNSSATFFNDNLINSINSIILELTKLPYAYFRCFGNYVTPLFDFISVWISTFFEKRISSLSNEQISIAYLALVNSFNIPNSKWIKNLDKYTKILFDNTIAGRCLSFEDDIHKEELLKALSTVYSNMEFQSSQYNWIFTPFMTLWNLNPNNPNQLDNFYDLFNDEDVVKALSYIFSYYLKVKSLDDQLHANLINSHLDTISLMQFISILKLSPNFNILNPLFVNPIQQILKFPLSDPLPYEEEGSSLKPSEVYRGFIDIYRELGYKNDILAQLMVIPLNPKLKLHRISELFWTQINEEVEFFPWQTQLEPSLLNRWDEYCEIDPSNENSIVKNAKLKLVHRFEDLNEYWVKFAQI